MPKRIVDGEGVWRSQRLKKVEPPSMRSEYANLIPLALANGSFEADPDLVWSMVYAYNRPDISVETAFAIFTEFERVGLLFRWKDGEGKLWGYWIGIEKPGRLPGESRRGKNERVGAEVPVDSMRKHLESIGIHTETNGIHGGNKKLLGFGSGLGLGKGSGSDIDDLIAFFEEAVALYPEKRREYGQATQAAYVDAIFDLKKLLNLDDVAAAQAKMVQAIKHYSSEKYPIAFSKFLSEKIYRNYQTAPRDPNQLPKFGPLDAEGRQTYL